MNKLGTTTLGKDFALGIIILVVFLIFMFGGGLGTILKLTSILKSIPSFVWWIIVALIIIKLLGGRK